MADVKLNFVIVCDDAIIAKDSGNLYILGVFDRIGAENFPAIHPRFSIVTKFSGRDGAYKQKIVIKHKDTQAKIIELPSDIALVGGNGVQFIANVANFPFPRMGEYLIEVYINGELMNLTASIYLIKNA